MHVRRGRFAVAVAGDTVCVGLAAGCGPVDSGAAAGWDFAAGTVCAGRLGNWNERHGAARAQRRDCGFGAGTDLCWSARDVAWERSRPTRCPHLSRAIAAAFGGDCEPGLTCDLARRRRNGHANLHDKRAGVRKCSIRSGEWSVRSQAGRFSSAAIGRADRGHEEIPAIGPISEGECGNYRRWNRSGGARRARLRGRRAALCCGGKGFAGPQWKSDAPGNSLGERCASAVKCLF